MLKHNFDRSLKHEIEPNVTAIVFSLLKQNIYSTKNQENMRSAEN